jgi:hypothetical protein
MDGPETALGSESDRSNRSRSSRGGGGGGGGLGGGMMGAMKEYKKSLGLAYEDLPAELFEASELELKVWSVP